MAAHQNTTQQVTPDDRIGLMLRVREWGSIYAGMELALRYLTGARDAVSTNDLRKRASISKVITDIELLRDKLHPGHITCSPLRNATEAMLNAGSAELPIASSGPPMLPQDRRDIAGRVFAAMIEQAGQEE